MLLDSQATISSCKINYHKAGGIYAHCTRDRELRIIDSTIKYCNVVGIYIQGEDSQP